MNNHGIVLVVFFSSVFLLAYPYTLYCVLLSFMKKVKEESSGTSPCVWPMVSVVISVHNSGSAIREKVGNIRSQDYPPELVELIIVSDGSTDDTCDIVSSLGGHPNLKLITEPRQVGKTAAENAARTAASGEIIVFTDATTLLETGALKGLIRHFSDPTVGSVSTVDRIAASRESSVSDGEGAYVRLEMYVRRLESAAGILVGLSGSCYACRRELYTDIPAPCTRDLYTAFLSLRRRYRNVSAEEAHCYIRTQNNLNKEFSRKVRTINNGFATMTEHLPLLNIFRYGKISFALISHKIVRWFSFVFLGTLFVCNLLLLDNCWMLWAPILLIQIGVYLAALYAFLTGKHLASDALRICVNFVIASAGAGVAFFEFLSGKRYVTWQPTERNANIVPRIVEGS
jgi:cellulose synthase/poly-beta-1,6-N-acetylglucosamine synthase-like glycosyltransferase